MKVPEATARFAALVQKAGQPEPVTLWTDPRQDARFQSAVKKNRVLTVKQEVVGTKKDFGVVGFYREKNVSYLIFPKPLSAFEGKRIVGINYSLLAAPKLSERASKTQPRARKKSEPKRIPKPPPRPPRFRVTVRHSAAIDLPLELEANNQKEARRIALESDPDQGVDFSRGNRSRKVVRVERLPD